jgi:hypothetical protein
MARDLEILAKVFGTKELVAGLDEMHRLVRMRLFGSLKNLAQRFAEDVATSGLAEQGIVSRSGRLARSFVVRPRLGNAGAWVLVYPNASDPKRKYRYPWALGQGSPKNETMVREYLRGIPSTAKPPKARGKWGRGHVYGRRQGEALVRAGARVVKAHPRKVNLRARPFMSGGALSRLQSVFAQKMEAAIQEAIREAQATTQAAAADFDGMGAS